MKTYQFQNNQLELHVQPSSKFGRGFIVFLGGIIFVMPIFGMVLGVILGADFHIGYLIGIGLCSLVAYHFYKLYHWNSCGKEVITFNENKVNYHADYGKFISNKQEFIYENLFIYVKPVGYEKEQLGVLLLEFGEHKFLETVVVLPLVTLNEIVENLKKNTIYKIAPESE